MKAIAFVLAGLIVLAGIRFAEGPAPQLLVDPAALDTKAGAASLVPVPPKRFQGNNAVLVVFVEPEQVEQFCGKASNGKERIACYGEAEGLPTIVAPSPCAVQDEYYERVMCHELGHRNGWPTDHGK